MTATLSIAKESASHGVRSNPENEKFAKDGSFKSVELMLQKLAIKCFKRVEAMGLSMEFADVHQEMLLSYVKAKAKWNPEGGAMFSTYCTTVCYNNFNLAIKKMERDRKEIGLVSFSEFHSPTHDNYAVDEADGAFFEGMLHATQADLPDFRLDMAAEFQENLSGLSSAARHLVLELMKSEQRNSNGPVKLRDICFSAKLHGEELTRVKKEILNKFGVRWN